MPFYDLSVDLPRCLWIGLSQLCNRSVRRRSQVLFHDASSRGCPVTSRIPGSNEFPIIDSHLWHAMRRWPQPAFAAFDQASILLVSILPWLSTSRSSTSGIAAHNTRRPQRYCLWRHLIFQRQLSSMNFKSPSGGPTPYLSCILMPTSSSERSFQWSATLPVYPCEASWQLPWKFHTFFTSLELFHQDWILYGYKLTPFMLISSQRKLSWSLLVVVWAQSFGWLMLACGLMWMRRRLRISWNGHE